MTGGALGPAAIAAFTGRKIDPEIAGRYGIFTGSWGENTGEVSPDYHGKIVVFPFIENDNVVGEKYRAPGKRFWQRKGGKKVFWNADILNDPRLAQGAPLIITEGELDALSAITCGLDLVVSVPDGAPPPRSEEAQEEGSIEAEQHGKFEFMWNARALLKGKDRRFILAVDNDAPGKQLEHELLRRLGAARCLFVTYPAGCKDLNDVLVKHGEAALVACISNAKPYPVKGLYGIDDYPEVNITTARHGIPHLDALIQPFPGGLCVVTGVPGHGKSTMVNQLCLGLWQEEGWVTGIFSPEMPVVPWMRDKMRRQVLKRVPCDAEDCATADDVIRRAFVFISDDPIAGGEDDLSMEWILDKATDAVMRYGIKALVIDPFNEIEHAKDRGESMPDYIGRILRKVKAWARLYSVYVIIVAHPTKAVAEGGKVRAVTPYDIEGSSHWFNKPDHIVVLDRDDEEQVTAVRVMKIRFQGTGLKGRVSMRFDEDTERFYPLDWKRENENPR